MLETSEGIRPSFQPTTAYRSLSYAFDRRLEEILATDREIADAHGVYERRVARTVAGAVGLAAGVAMFATAVGAMVSAWRIDPRSPSAPLVELLFAAWALGIPAYIVARVVLRARRSSRAAPLLRTADAAADLARLETMRPGVVLHRLATARERLSIALPMMALSLVVPLTLHCAIGFLFGWLVWGNVDAELGSWICLSTAFVGHAHLALAACCWAYARRVQSLPSDEMHTRKNRGWGAALATATACAAVPGIVFLVIPPLIALATGAAFIPWMYVSMRKRILRERRILETCLG